MGLAVATVNGHTGALEQGLQGADWALMLGILRFVRAQLPLLVASLENQARAMVEEFRALSEAAQQHSAQLNEVIEISRQIEIHGRIVPFGQSVEILYEPLADAIDKILEVSKLSMEMVINIGNAAENIERMEKSIAQVQELTKQTNMLAMNTQIEAARTGEFGKSFHIIAQEVKALSDRIKLVSTDIKKEVGCVAISVRRSSRLVDNLAHFDMTENLQLRDRVGALIESILQQNEQFSQLLENAAVAAAQTAGSIHTLIMGVQFKDKSAQIGNDLCSLMDYTLSRLESSLAPCDGLIDDTQLEQVAATLRLGDMRRQLVLSLADAGHVRPTNPLFVRSKTYFPAGSD